MRYFNLPKMADFHLLRTTHFNLPKTQVLQFPQNDLFQSDENNTFQCPENSTTQSPETETQQQFPRIPEKCFATNSTSQKTINCDFVNSIDAHAAINKTLESLFTYEAFCADFDKHFNAENEVFASYISFSDFITKSITPEPWFDCIMKRNRPHYPAQSVRESAVSGDTIMNFLN